MILETKRLWLREMREEDFGDLCEMLCDEEVMYAYAHPFSLCEAREWLHKQFQRYREDGVGLWAVLRKEDGAMIGQCGLTKQQIKDEQVWEIGYLLKKDEWHKGYAIEAAQGVKRYAKENLHLSSVYSIVRDQNIASQRVALANGMKEVGRIVKHYHHMDMEHIVYKCELVKSLGHVHIYLDGEFDAVRIQHRYQQMVISLGAVACDERGNELSTFYETVYPYEFKRLTPIVRRMTHLQNCMITSSRRLSAVMQDFEAWVRSFKDTTLYSFGPDDRRTIVQHCAIEQVEIHGLLDHVLDLQKELSRKITYQKRIVSSTLSLEDMKQVFQIEGTVEHNALNDAKDLMKIHWAYLQGKTMNEHQIQKIVERKEQKALEARIKQQKHFREVMQERFAHIQTHVDIAYHSEVLDQLRNWEMRDTHFKLHFKKSFMVFEGKQYHYDQLQLELMIHTDEEYPSVILRMQYPDENREFKYLLDYRNATPIEGILKRCGKETYKNDNRS